MLPWVSLKTFNATPIVSGGRGVGDGDGRGASGQFYEVWVEANRNRGVFLGSAFVPYGVIRKNGMNCALRVVLC